MKKKWLLLLALALMLVSCGTKTEPAKTPAPETPAQEAAVATPAEEKKEEKPVTGETSNIVVFAAASLTESLNEIAELYKKEHPGVSFTFTYDSSGTLKTQIEEGADADLFISAAQKQMNQLDIASDKNEAKLDFVDSATRVNLVENKVTLAVPAGNPAGVKEFADVNTDTVKTVALGNSDVPVGQYSEELFTSLGIWDAIQPKVTFGSNVKEVTTWVAEKAADCGVVYSTDAKSAGLEIVAEATSEMIKTPVVYPAAVLKNAKNAEAAKGFLDFLQTQPARDVFTKIGFAIPQ